MCESSNPLDVAAMCALGSEPFDAFFKEVMRVEPSVPPTFLEEHLNPKERLGLRT